MASISSALRRTPKQSEQDAANGSLHIPSSIHTLSGFRDWIHSKDFPEKLRALFWRGEVWLDLSLEESRTHAAVKTEMIGVLTNLNEDLDLGNLYINGVRVTDEEADVSNNPDMVGVFWESLEAGRVRYESRKGRETEIVGSPDWLLEIVSVSSVTKDLKQLRQAYHDAGVKEYWLIDARGDDIEFRIWVWKPKGYQAARTQEGWTTSPVFGKSFRLTRLADRRGAWRYRLEVK